jgi:hypothetical protein
VACAIFQAPDGSVELRVGYAADHIIRSERLADAAAARTRAEQWLSAFRAVGSFRT